MNKKRYIELKKKLKALSRKDTENEFYDKDTRKKYYGRVLDEVSQVCFRNPDYKFFIQKICYKNKKDKPKNYWYRFCYWVITRKKDKIIFGQYAAHIDKKTLNILISKAKKKGFF